MKALAIALAVIFFVAAVVYVVPGGPLGHHVKHAAVLFVLAVLALVWLRFLAGSTPSRVR